MKIDKQSIKIGNTYGAVNSVPIINDIPTLHQDINESVKDFHRYNKYGKTNINWTEIITGALLGIVVGHLIVKMIIYVPNL